VPVVKKQVCLCLRGYTNLLQEWAFINLYKGKAAAGLVHCGNNGKNYGSNNSKL
jgi:hypothetical protein